MHDTVIENLTELKQRNDELKNLRQRLVDKPSEHVVKGLPQITEVTNNLIHRPRLSS